MADVAQRCVNHPNAETRLSCTQCGDPICPRCMRQGAVGQKCPDCARLPRSARALGKPRDYVRLALVAPVTVIVGGLAFAFGLGLTGGFALILSALVGFGIGRVLRAAVRGQTQQPFSGVAAACGGLAIAAGLLFAIGSPFPRSPFLLLAYLVAGYTSVRGLSN